MMIMVTIMTKVIALTVSFLDTIRFPSEADLRAHYLEDLNWSEYKKNVVHTHHLEKTGCVMASIPATLKGSSGWARWPGYSVLPRMDKVCKRSLTCMLYTSFVRGLYEF